MTETSSMSDSQSNGDDDEIHFFDLLIVLARNKLLVLGFPFAVAVLAAVYSLLAPSIYTATTKIVTPQSQASGSAMLAQLTGLAGLVGGATGVRNPNELYVGMLRSRTVADNLIKRFDLMKSSGAKYQSQVRLELEGVTNITIGRDGIITIEVNDKDPKRAADIADAYVEELLKLTQVLAVTEASQRRLFFERQFSQAKDNLAKAEMAARQGLAKGGLVKVDDQGRAMVEATARLRAQIAVKEVQIGAMRTFAAEGNPDLRFAQQEVESMRRELAKLEGASGLKGAGTDSDSKGIDSLRLLRDVKYYETIYELLAKQYELAKIDEAKDSAVIQVMDKAIEPDFRSSPKRRQIVMVSTLIAGFLALLLAFVKEAIARARENPEQLRRLQTLRSALKAK